MTEVEVLDIETEGCILKVIVENEMNRDEVLEKIGDGTVCSVKFTKKNGELRTLNGRLGVKKHLKGGQKAFDDAEKNLVTIYDIQKQAYRSFSVDRLIEIKAHGEVWRFSNES